MSAIPFPRPNWTTRYRVGRRLNESLDHFCTLQELGDELGISKQNAYTESAVALGTLVCELARRLSIPLHEITGTRR